MSATQCDSGQQPGPLAHVFPSTIVSSFESDPLDRTAALEATGKFQELVTFQRGQQLKFKRICQVQEESRHISPSCRARMGLGLCPVLCPQLFSPAARCLGGSRAPCRSLHPCMRLPVLPPSVPQTHGKLTPASEPLRWLLPAWGSSLSRWFSVLTAHWNPLGSF